MILLEKIIPITLYLPTGIMRLVGVYKEIATSGEVHFFCPRTTDSKFDSVSDCC